MLDAVVGSFTVYIGAISVLFAVTGYAAVDVAFLFALYPIALHPVPDKFVSDGFGAFIVDTLFAFAFKYCVTVEFVTLSTPELNFTVLLYTALYSASPDVITEFRSYCCSSALLSFLNPIAIHPSIGSGVGVSTVYASCVL